MSADAAVEDLRDRVGGLSRCGAWVGRRAIRVFAGCRTGRVRRASWGGWQSFGRCLERRMIVGCRCAVRLLRAVTVVRAGVWMRSTGWAGLQQTVDLRPHRGGGFILAQLRCGLFGARKLMMWVLSGWGRIVGVGDFVGRVGRARCGFGCRCWGLRSLGGALAVSWAVGLVLLVCFCGFVCTGACRGS